MTMQMDTDTVAHRRPEERLAELQAEHPTANLLQIGNFYKGEIRRHTDFDRDEIEFQVLCVIDEWLAHWRDKEESAEADPETSAEPNPQPQSKRRRRATTRTKAERRKARESVAAQFKAAVDEHIEEEVTIRLLEWQTPYGKPLKECTGAECGRLKRRFGSFFAELEKRLNPAEKVGAHMTEQELQAIGLTHRLIGVKAHR